MKIARIILVCLILAIPTSTRSESADKSSESTGMSGSQSVDADTYIDANEILMMVTNVANFGRDVDDVFGWDYGTWWPYCGDTYFISDKDLEDGKRSPLYQAGLWLGGIDSATGDTMITISEFSSEYVPGPMYNGTFMPDDPSFRTYKLHRDSLADNPNQDYLDWPVDQGAPVDDDGNPAMLGREMLWSVCNDADPEAHTNDGGETEPLGVEVHQTVWAFWDVGGDTLSFPSRVEVFQLGSTSAEVSIHVVDYDAITEHDYYIVIDSGGTHQPVWDLIDRTLGQTILDNQPIGLTDTVVGLSIRVTADPPIFTSFQVVANASGVLDPPDAGALWYLGFPVPTELDPAGYITWDQQVGDGRWAVHIDDNGGTSGGGTNSEYETFVDIVTREGANLNAISSYDYEMRFTGSNDNPDVGGGYAVEWPGSGNAFWVPFELWRTGIGTPDDPSDDIRLVPYIVDRWGTPGVWEGDDLFELESWGSSADGTCSGDCEHSASAGDDDPWTDQVFWNMPTDSTPGQSGYLANEATMRAETFDGSLTAYEIMARTVLINYSAGVEPPFEQDCPELGTVFRIITAETIPRDTFEFATSQAQLFVDSLEGSSVYVRYKIYNKGENTINNMYLGLWTDPDVGNASDDLVGCDTINDISFSYNSDNEDNEYGTCPPAIGFKFLYGPVVPSTGETAFFDGQELADHKNLGMTSWQNIIQGGVTDFEQAYGYMQGLVGGRWPYIYEDDTLTYSYSGDPVQGVGDLDYPPDDHKMIAGCGPFDFRPGDSQFVLIKMSVARGPDNLQSLTAVKALLNSDFDPLTDTIGIHAPPLPNSFWVSQNYPNPFNPSTTIAYRLSQRAHVTVDVYNILGQKIRRLRDRVQPAGEYQVQWNGTNASGEVVATGLYFYRVQAGNLIDSKKMVLLK